MEYVARLLWTTSALSHIALHTLLCKAVRPGLPAEWITGQGGQYCQWLLLLQEAQLLQRPLLLKAQIHHQGPLRSPDHSTRHPGHRCPHLHQRRHHRLPTHTCLPCGCQTMEHGQPRLQQTNRCTHAPCCTHATTGCACTNTGTSSVQSQANMLPMGIQY